MKGIRVSLWAICLTIAVALTGNVIGADEATPKENTKAVSKLKNQWDRISRNGFSTPEEAKATLATFENDKKFILSLNKKYEGQKGADKDEKNLIFKLRSCLIDLQKFEEFLAGARDYMPKKINKSLDRENLTAQKMGGMIKQIRSQGQDPPPHMVKMFAQQSKFKSIKEDIAMYCAILGDSNAEAQKFEAEIVAKLKAINKIREEMGSTDLVVTPPNLYKGSDKAELEKKITADWKASHPKDEILGVRFHQPDWTRRTESRYDENFNRWYPIDVSTMEVNVVVKKDSETAEIFMSVLEKDHLNKDDLVIDVTSGKRSPLLIQEMPLKNYKP